MNNLSESDQSVLLRELCQKHGLEPETVVGCDATANRASYGQ